MPTTTVSKTETDRKDREKNQVQYRTTIPKGLAEAFDLAGTEIEWEAVSQNTLKVTKVEE